MVASYVALPRTTFDIVTRDQIVGLEDNRMLVFVQKTGAGSAAVGLSVDVPRTPAELDALFGPTSHGAFVTKAIRRANPWTPMDAVVFADNGSGVAATSQIVFSGTATASGTLLITIASRSQHEFEVNVNVGDTAATVAAALVAAIALGGSMPFTTGISTATVTFTAVSKGTHANGWPLIVSGSVAGLGVALTGWASGATDPSLTTAFDTVLDMRHQHIFWPSSWVRTGLKSYLEARKNVDNAVMEGRAFIWDALDLATCMSDALAMNSSEIVLMTNKPNSGATWKGPHLPEAPDVLSSTFMAERARRFETNISIADIVTTNEPRDQFGGQHTASLPYFNTPLLNVGLPMKGTGYSQFEQVELRDAGVTVVGANRSWTGVVMGEVVTTWLDDNAGNPDDTWKYLEWRDTHGLIREFIVVNTRKRFAQYRMTNGDAVPNVAMVTVDMVRSWIMGLCQLLMNDALVQSGQASRQYIQDNMTVSFDLANRTANVYLTVPIVSQLAQILGTVKFSFQTA